MNIGVGRAAVVVVMSSITNIDLPDFCHRDAGSTAPLHGLNANTIQKAQRSSTPVYL